MRTLEEVFETPKGKVRIKSSTGYNFNVYHDNYLVLENVSLDLGRKYKDKQWSLFK